MGNLACDFYQNDDAADKASTLDMAREQAIEEMVNLHIGSKLTIDQEQLISDLLDKHFSQNTDLVDAFIEKQGVH